MGLNHSLHEDILVLGQERFLQSTPTSLQHMQAIFEDSPTHQLSHPWYSQQANQRYNSHTISLVHIHINISNFPTLHVLRAHSPSNLGFFNTLTL